jgi:hypothetical protein
MHFTKTAAWRRVRRAQFGGRLDLFARLQVLEGAAGVGDGDWTKNLSRGLKAAQDALPDIDPEWFQPSDLYTTLVNKVRRMLVSGKVTDEDPEGVVNRLLAGMQISGKKVEPPLYTAGEKARSGILSGHENPGSMGAGFAGKWFENAGLDLVRSRLRHITKHDKHREKFVDLDTKTQLSVLTELFLDPHSRLGKKIREEMRESWERMDPAQERAANAWLDEIERTGKVPKQRALAEEIGMHEQTVSKGIREGKKLARAAILSNNRLMDEIEEHYETEGVGGNWTVRGSLIRLAHRVPKYRRYLVPLLRRTAHLGER